MPQGKPKRRNDGVEAGMFKRPVTAKLTGCSARHTTNTEWANSVKYRNYY